MVGQYVFLKDGICPNCGCQEWLDGDEEYSDGSVETVFTCDDCDKSFRAIYKFIKTAESIPGPFEVGKCPYCGHSPDWLDGLEDYGDDRVETVFICEECKKSVTAIYKLDKVLEEK